MKYYYDFHIHTGLSPCADAEMTPNNIINMAQLKGLDIIAVSDHNTTGNLRSVFECASETDILVIPAIEAETSEEVHVLCLFPTLEAAEKVGALIYNSLPELKNRPDIFGEQILYDQNDNIMGYEPKMLVTATGLSLDKLKNNVESTGGIAIPAHVDRNSFSILSNLGFIPEEMNFTTLEISKKCNLTTFFDKHQQVKNYNIIYNSDSHHLGDISEPDAHMDLEIKSIDAILKFLKNM